MESIQEAKRSLNSQLIFKCSQIGFALRSTLCYTNRINVGIHDYADYVAQLRDGDSIFISTSETAVSIQTIISILRARNIRVVFYIMEEPLIPWDIVERLLPVSIRILIQNNSYDHPKIGIMPIGIRDDGDVVVAHHQFKHASLYEIGSELRSNDIIGVRPIKCMLCFSVWTHHSRKECYHCFTTPSRSFILNLNESASEFHNKDSGSILGKIQPIVVYRKTTESQYALCPRGCGVDTHRFYECIYLGCVPIVVRTNTVFDRLYREFPCLIVNKWADVTEELLDRSYPECQAKMRDFHARYPRFLTDLDSIEDLLLRL